MMEEAAPKHDAAVVQAAEIVGSRALRTLAVLTSLKTLSSAKEFVKIVTEKAQPPLSSINIVFMETIPCDSLLDASLRVVFPGDLQPGESLKLDGCFDLICTESSIKFATQHVEPLGTLILSAPSAQDPPSAIAIDMNAVVVNELVLMHVGDHHAEPSREHASTTTQAASSV